MKQTTLEDLYYGNINPDELSFVRGSEYGKCFYTVNLFLLPQSRYARQLPSEGAYLFLKRFLISINSQGFVFIIIYRTIQIGPNDEIFLKSKILLH